MGTERTGSPGHAGQVTEPTVIPTADTADVDHRALWQTLGLSFEDALAVAWDAAARLELDRHAARDRCAAVFESLARAHAAGRLKVHTNGASYVRTAVLNEHRDHVRRAHAQARGGGVPDQIIDVDIAADRLPTSAGDPCDVIVSNSFVAALGDVISSLPLNEQRVVNLLVNGGYSKAEIADFLGLPRTTVNSRIKATQAQIRRQLRRMGWEVER